MPSAIDAAMQVICRDRLDQLTASARTSERLRRNLNLHDSYDEPCQRLFNAIEPGTYVRPHRHTTPPKTETFVVIRGGLVLVLFDDKGFPVRWVELRAGGGNLAADLLPGVWHMVISLESGTLFFEAKPGPYAPLSDKDFAPWAPPEGSSEAAGYLQEVLAVVSHADDQRGEDHA